MAPESDSVPVTFDAATALVVVDQQNDFAHPEGSLFVDRGDTLTPTINELVAAAREAGAAVVYTQDWHPPTTPHFVTEGGVWPVHCVRDTWGAALVDELEVAGPVVRKGTGGEDGYSGFTMADPETGEITPTELDGLLREAGIERVVVVGLALDVCVKATALDAVANGYETIVPLAASAPVNLDPDDGHRAVLEMAAAGVAVV